MLKSLDDIIRKLQEIFEVSISCTAETYKNPFNESEIDRQDLKGDFNDAIKKKRSLVVWDRSHASVLFEKNNDGRVQYAAE